MAGRRRWMVWACVLVLLAACGDDAEPAAGGPGSPATDSADTGATEGGGSATITSGDTVVRFSMDDLTFSPIDGVDDVTFETCDPSFFGAAFYAIGYPVDEAGELILDDDGDLAGIMSLTLPLDEAGEEIAGEAEFDLDYSPLDFDLKLASDDLVAEMDTDGESSWTFDGNRVSGTAVFATVLSEPTVLEFDISCS